MKGICMICGKKVEKDKSYVGDYSCNGAVLGEVIKFKGHRTCVDRVNDLVVLPNRMRLRTYVKQTN